MEIRDAVEADAAAVAELVDVPRDVLHDVIHDRTVRIAENRGDIVGCVSFDARPGTVYVTQIGGSGAVYKRLLEEPLRFARRENMAVELIAPNDDTPLHEAAAAVGFTEIEEGPRFNGVATTKFRFHPDA